MDEDLTYEKRLIQEYQSAKDMADSAKKRADKLKKELVEIVDSKGYEGENGHIWYEVGDHKLKRERRVSRVFNSTECETWARQNKLLWEQVSEVVEVLSEDKVLALAWDDTDVQSKIMDFYEERITWAFKL